jgi:hypothetical protein
MEVATILFLILPLRGRHGILEKVEKDCHGEGTWNRGRGISWRWLVIGLRRREERGDANNRCQPSGTLEVDF